MTLDLPVEEICKKYLSGINIGKLAEEYKCSIYIITKRLTDNRIKFRSRSEVYIKLQLGKDNPNYRKLPTEEICEKYQNGMNINELAKEYKCAYSTIRKRIYDSKIEIIPKNFEGKNNSNYRKLPTEEICEKYLSGINSTIIAKEYKCSHTTIVERLRDNGIKIRLSSESLVGTKHTLESRQHMSAGHQGIPYEEWNGFIDHSGWRNWSKAIYLNEPFEGCDRHHLTETIVICIPKELHRHIHHNLRTGYNMGEMNMLALQFINGEY